MVVVLDDVGFAQLGCYGSDIDTPTFDRLAAGGLRYSRFHTTALCSPTRAALLTGRNHHSVGMGTVPEIAMGYPGYHTRIPRARGDAARDPARPGLRDVRGRQVAPHPGRGAALGRDPGAVAARARLRPLLRLPRRPDRPVEPRARPRQHAPRPAESRLRRPRRRGIPPHRRPRRQGHRDGARPEIGRTHPAVPPLLRARRVPRAAPRAEVMVRPLPRPVRRRVGRVARTRGSSARRSSGSSPSSPSSRRASPTCARGTTSPRRRAAARGADDGGVRGLPVARRPPRRAASSTSSTRSASSTTRIVLVMSDNGASAEGGPHGTVNEALLFNGVPESLDDNLAMLDELGGPRTRPNYPTGWTSAGCAPFRRWKTDVYRGGVTDPLIVHWPNGIAARGELRHQWCHVTDITPTMLETLGIDAARDAQRRGADAARRREHRALVRRRRRADAQAGAVLRELRPARDLGRRAGRRSSGIAR